MSGSGKKEKDRRDELTANQERFLVDLLTAPTIAEAAKETGINESTARRWLSQRPVQRAWRELRRQVVEQALTGVQSATVEAVATLRACLAEDMPPAVRVRAALALLDLAARTVEIGDLAARIEQLEEAIEQNSQEPHWPGQLRQLA